MSLCRLYQINVSKPTSSKVGRFQNLGRFKTFTIAPFFVIFLFCFTILSIFSLLDLLMANQIATERWNGV
jgi:hypothetical protein